MKDFKNDSDSFFDESYKYQIDIWYKAYNINHEKLELFHDFLLMLYENINNTYLGSDVIIDNKDEKSHFDWCWNKTIDSFNKEKIFFKKNGIHYEYLWNFFHEAYYYANANNKKNKILNYISVLFNFKHQKTRSEIDVLTELYKLLNDSLNF
jgi:hypothetical protein